MKPAWDDLMAYYKDSTTATVGDVDCTVHQDLCSEHGVKGYPTIKYYTAETGPAGESYSGGRDADALKKFMEEKIDVSPPCQLEDTEKCEEKELKYIEKMKAKAAGERKKEHGRLQKMRGNKMTRDQTKWLNQRLAILAQFKDE
eukprot:TRINITY_DN2244_c0_g1_i1.p1 TRINITY_DN2244_c0_g1~~TRINITY_DN2244_c0_g1_i1.p1  ORF type:complete len:144 (+),score=44.07 TRINITY_DN2244_c0_g1_i1:192-623(+)